MEPTFAVFARLVGGGLPASAYHGTVEKSGAYLFAAVWQPDGEWIAYSRTVGGFIADVFVSRIDGFRCVAGDRHRRQEIGVAWGPDSS